MRLTAFAGAAVVLSGCGPHHPIGDTATAVGPIIRLDMVDASHGWALTARKVLTTSDGGVTWVTVSAPGPDVDPGRLAIVSPVSPSTAWACEPGRWRGAGPQQASGDYLFQRLLPDRCFVTTDGGHSWVAHDIAGTGGTVSRRDKITQTVTWLVALDASHALAIVQDDRAHVGGGQESDALTALRLIRSDDRGATWITLRQRVPQQDGTPALLAFPRIVTSQQHAWLVGFMPGELDRSDDGGSTWAEVPLPSSLRLNDPAGSLGLGTPSPPGLTTVTIPVFGEEQHSVELLTSRDDGATWKITVPRTCIQVCSDASAPGGHGWAITDWDTLLITHDLGATWTVVAPPKPYSTFLDVDMVTSRLGWTLVRNESGESAVLTTHDGGLTWSSPRPAGGR